MNYTRKSKLHSHVDGRGIKALVMSANDCKDYGALDQVGVIMRRDKVHEMKTAMDASLNAPVNGAPLQFLQTFAPNLVRVVTSPRKIDELVGVDTIGNWYDEEIVQGIKAPTGKASLYGDTTNIPLASYEVEYDTRTVLRFEQGFAYGKLESERAGAMGIDAVNEKRISATLALEISRNLIGLYGYNNGTGRTFGFLNDPSLPAYTTLPSGDKGSTGWKDKSFLELTADIRLMEAQLAEQTQGLVSALNDNVTLALPVNCLAYLTVTSDYGNSVQDWINKTFPKMRIVGVPELGEAVGGENAAYLYAESVLDSGEDNGATFGQLVPAKFVLVGSKVDIKGYTEDSTNATAGVICKRPYAVVRAIGL